jgi:hypothetical protein
VCVGVCVCVGLCMRSFLHFGLGFVVCGGGCGLSVFVCVCVRFSEICANLLAFLQVDRPLAESMVHFETDAHHWLADEQTHRQPHSLTDAHTDGFNQGCPRASYRPTEMNTPTDSLRDGQTGRQADRQADS